jgi:hypothetical protein
MDLGKAVDQLVQGLYALGCYSGIEASYHPVARGMHMAGRYHSEMWQDVCRFQFFLSPSLVTDPNLDAVAFVHEYVSRSDVLDLPRSKVMMR